MVNKTINPQINCNEKSTKKKNGDKNWCGKVESPFNSRARHHEIKSLTPIFFQIDFPTPDEPKSHTTDISMSISNTDKTSSINIDENSSSDDIEYYVDKTDTDQSDDQDISKEHADFTSSEKRDDNDENCNGSWR